MDQRRKRRRARSEAGSPDQHRLSVAFQTVQTKGTGTVRHTTSGPGCTSIFVRARYVSQSEDISGENGDFGWGFLTDTTSNGCPRVNTWFSGFRREVALGHGYAFGCDGEGLGQGLRRALGNTAQ